MRTAHRAALAAATAGLVSSLVVPTAPPAWSRSLAAAPAAADASRDTLMTYARSTWRSMDAMVDPRTGLVADNIAGDLAGGSRSAYTSPTNIGGYLWSTVVARDLGILTRDQARSRLARTLDAIGRLERHPASGMFYNWYDPADGHKLRTWPENGNTVHPFLSSVDNGWMGAALLVTANAEPRLAGQARSLLRPMDFGFYYDPNAKGADSPAGLIRGGFWDEKPPGCSVQGNYRGRGPDVFFTCHHYGSFNSEPRIASYLGIALGQIPREHYFGPWRTFPDTCDWSWQEQKPVGEWKTYLGVPVFEGAYRYRGMQVVPSWGGDMFESLMPDLFVPEASWGPRSWGVNHPLTVRAQIEHGMDEAGYGYWGFSPASNPAGGYREYGVDAIGLDAPGYTSDQERTTVDYGFEGCEGRPAQPLPATYGDGVVTPHASFLALPYARDAALDNLARLRADFDAYGPGGFYDAVAVRSGQVAKRYLALDQAMVLGALGNVLGDGLLHGYFTRGPVQDVLRPIMRLEEFGARPRGATP